MFQRQVFNIGIILTIFLGSFHLNAQETKSSNEEKKHFSKIYVGAEIGYLDIDEDNGVSAGAFIGGRHQRRDDIVLGLELGLNGVLKDDTAGVVSILGTIGIVTGEDKKSLVYVGAGYESGLSLENGDGFLGTNEGFSIVSGYERAIHDNISLRVQGKYINLGSTFDDIGNDISLNGFSLTAGISFNF
ncbi:outer membrane protein [Kordiimonas sp. SCSIO 12610]|uniref:outer membrane protein n=1 Tax=Kordiimonas sp. SCSIO 12610 TaxID=2829597 RepID=UPI0021086391|nr:outer membrane beta-barrel protein [Kordiimonas sp. SCSIO 12610]UTW54574.1 outer membrane beta-barrel protein [Kordiimonas sp. SCSIO 12610]